MSEENNDKRERREQSGPTINVLATMEDAMCKLQLLNYEKEYLQQNGPIDANSGSSWVACTGSSSCSGKDFMQAGPSQSDRSTGQLHQDDKGWGCLGTTRYQSTQIFMFYVPEAFECAACPTDGTVVEGCQPPCVDGTSFSYWSIRKSTCP